MTNDARTESAGWREKIAWGNAKAILSQASGLDLPVGATVFLAFTILLGAASFSHGMSDWDIKDPLMFFAYLILTSLSSAFKVGLPSIPGTMSVNFLFILVCLSTMSLAETLTVACTATVVQCVWKAKTNPAPVRILFNVANVATALTVAFHVYHSHLLIRLGVAHPLLLAMGASTYFFLNTFPVAIVICLTDGRKLGKVWTECYFWSFPYYLVGAGIAVVIRALNQAIGWESALLVVPVIYAIYRSYRQYLLRLESEKTHAEEMARLHLRTIQALALAIEAKDFTTYSHLQRVSVYANGLGKELKLDESQLQALWAASLLHDIGKLAVPEHIISKPGKLTRAEFEKMKIHPIVGAEILEQVEFPYPVVPIVLSHHEKWDGSGYPYGLKGEEIPIGARILAAVDCLDALASDRQYRKALPLDEAMAFVDSQSGKSFDPAIVALLKKRYIELEKRVQAEPLTGAKLSRRLHTGNQAEPAAGLASPGGETQGGKTPEFLSSIAAARHEAQQLFELTHELGSSLNLNETLSVLSIRLKRLCPYDCIAIYVLRGDSLCPEFVSGQDFALFSSLEIPIGEGLSGWVAANLQPIVNGNPSVEPGYLNDPNKFSSLQSALAIPLEGPDGVVGVLALYHSKREAFTEDHQRIMMAVSTKVALSIENALKYRQAETSATTDALTGLPNARSLFLHLDSELARCKRLNLPLTVLVCDLDGFKQVNDRFGHLEGNRVLRAVADGIKECCREYDYAARMGGDEFVLVLPDYKGHADSLIQRLSDVVVHAAIDLFGEPILALSTGKAVYPDDGEDAEQLLTRGDHDMYRVKMEHKTQREMDHTHSVQALDRATQTSAKPVKPQMPGVQP
jgi:diguanylate cyclase (GGDEF)-like protein/putative nucleotidyltransferase with HDIG domain